MRNNILKGGGAVAIDDYDIAILSALSDNAELTTIELSKLIHLSRTAVARRIIKLRDSGVVSPARVDVHYDKLGFLIRAHVEISAPNQDTFAMRDRLLERPEVLRLSTVLGKHLIIAEIIAVDSKHLHQFLTWVNDHGASETTVVLQQLRSNISFRNRIAMIEHERQNVDSRLAIVAAEN